MDLSLLNSEGKKTGKMSASDAVFSVPNNEHVVHETLVWYLASRRRGTHSAKTMGEVSGSGVKPWKQKGTGRARAGKKRSPLWAGGGVIFPPKPRSYSYNLPKKVRKLALKVVLSDKARASKIKVVDSFKIASPKTKEMVLFLKNVGAEGKALIVIGAEEKNLSLSARNINNIIVSKATEINIHDLLSCEWIILDKSAVNKLEEVLK